MKPAKRTHLVTAAALLILLLAPATAQARKATAGKGKGAPAKTSGAPAASPSDLTPAEAERVSVDAIKEKYWARGDESQLGVVQNRLYSKERKLEIGLFGGFLTSDPFIQTKTMGGSVGFHFSEYFGLHFLAWKPYVDPSSAFKSFQDTIKDAGGVPAVPSTNEPKFYYGTEASASILYGKLSLLGKAIIYYDMHLLGGMGITGTETGKNFTPSLGVGQKIYVSKAMSIRVDYRLMRYTETLVRKAASVDAAAPPTLGQPIGNRANWTNAITIGVNFLMGAN